MKILFFKERGCFFCPDIAQIFRKIKDATNKNNPRYRSAIGRPLFILECECCVTSAMLHRNIGNARNTHILFENNEKGIVVFRE